MEYEYLGDSDNGDYGDPYCVEECRMRLCDAVKVLVKGNFHHDLWAAVECRLEELEGHLTHDCVTLVCEVHHQWHSLIIRDAGVPTTGDFFAPRDAEATP